MGFGARIGLALAGAVLLGFAGFLGWQEGLPAYQRSQGVPAVSDSETLALPERIYDPPPYVRSTDDWGPPGPVGVVFQGRSALEGFTGQISAPWYAVSARTGDYWRLSAPHLADAQGQVVLGPDGSQVAWAWSEGVAVYDLMTGDTASYPKAAGAQPGSPLAWSPDGSRIAFGADPVRVLDIPTGDVRDLPLRVPEGSRVTPAWTADGRWVTVPGGDAVEAVEVASGEQQDVAVHLGRFFGGDWSTGGTFAGVHPKEFGEVVRNVVRVVRTSGLAGDPEVEVADVSPNGLIIEGFLGWVDAGELVLTGSSPATGGIELSMAMSLQDRSLRPYMSFPTRGDNWAGTRTVSLAADLMKLPTRAYDAPLKPWSAGAKLITCMLVAVFPMVYFLLARRPRSR